MDTQRLSTAAMLILAAAGDGPIHGYAIGKDIERRTQGEVSLGATSLYRTIKQLLDAGYLHESSPRPLPESDDERRRYFRTSAAGRRALEAEARRLDRVLAATGSRLPAARRSRT
jgi:DNA-binding PadR family transcriptional regulator